MKILFTAFYVLFFTATFLSSYETADVFVEEILKGWLKSDPFGFCSRFSSLCLSKNVEYKYSNFLDKMRREIETLAEIQFREGRILCEYKNDSRFANAFAEYSMFSWKMHEIVKRNDFNLEFFEVVMHATPQDWRKEFERGFLPIFGCFFEMAAKFYAEDLRKLSYQVGSHSSTFLNHLYIKRHSGMLSASYWRKSRLVPEFANPTDIRTMYEYVNALDFYQLQYRKNLMPQHFSLITSSETALSCGAVEAVFQSLLNLPKFVELIYNSQNRDPENPYFTVFVQLIEIYHFQKPNRPKILVEYDLVKALITLSSNDQIINPVDIFRNLVRLISYQKNFDSEYANNAKFQDPRLTEAMNLFNIHTQLDHCLRPCQCKNPNLQPIGFNLLPVNHEHRRITEIEISINISSEYNQDKLPEYCLISCQKFSVVGIYSPIYIFPEYFLFTTDNYALPHIPNRLPHTLNFSMIDGIMLNWNGFSAHYRFSQALCVINQPAASQIQYYNLIKRGDELIVSTTEEVFSIDIRRERQRFAEFTSSGIVYVIFEKVI